jgi:recombination protein RecR
MNNKPGLSHGICQLIDALQCLPGVGSKSAERMTWQLLQHQTAQARHLAHSIEHALDTVNPCQSCNMLCDELTCEYCRHPGRDPQVLCVVESPSDVLALEQTASYRGRYFVLKGHLSPIDGLGPNEIDIPKLFALVTEHPITEVILATNPTVEGEATAHYIAEQLKSKHITTSRIAHGVPMGGHLHYLDSHTLRHAFIERKRL